MQRRRGRLLEDQPHDTQTWEMLPKTYYEAEIDGVKTTGQWTLKNAKAINASGTLLVEVSDTSGLNYLPAILVLE